MTITLTIRPEVEAELARQAQLAGRGLEAYAAALLEDAIHLPAPEASGFTGQALVDACAKVRGLLTDEEIDTMFRRNPSTARRRELRGVPQRHHHASAGKAAR
jgi:hypothetical protein